MAECGHVVLGGLKSLLQPCFDMIRGGGVSAALTNVMGPLCQWGHLGYSKKGRKQQGPPEFGQQ